MIDHTMRIHPSARAVAALLDNHDGIEASWDDKNKHYRAVIEMAPWYNGRERGLVFVLRDDDWKIRETVVAVVFEHRNSDKICVLHWEHEHNYLNPPTLDDVPKGIYKDKYDVSASFAHDEHEKAATYIYDLFNKFCKREF